MGCDMVVALGRATVDGQTLFGQNSGLPMGEKQILCRIPGREFAPGEKVHAQYIELLQARNTFTVLATKPDDWWGYCQGMNEHGVGMGCTVLQNKINCPEPGLTGGDLVRLALERSHSARQAVDLLGELIERHGQSSPPGNCYPAGGDNGFLIADGAEA
ncbi:MAG TPA: carcinine hydrolase/isopenicillin-N N-acyltransferase family protein, partial [Gemmataceae bacterium]|nr:carcinine hydrolase/isopenicillin-N N-acyltransferase family protein [Gemmataceae bacterium]